MAGLHCYSAVLWLLVHRTSQYDCILWSRAVHDKCNPWHAIAVCALALESAVGHRLHLLASSMAAALPRCKYKMIKIVAPCGPWPMYLMAVAMWVQLLWEVPCGCSGSGSKVPCPKCIKKRRTGE